MFVKESPYFLKLKIFAYSFLNKYTTAQKG